MAQDLYQLLKETHKNANLFKTVLNESEHYSISEAENDTVDMEDTEIEPEDDMSEIDVDSDEPTEDLPPAPESEEMNDSEGDDNFDDIDVSDDMDNADDMDMEDSGEADYADMDDMDGDEDMDDMDDDITVDTTETDMDYDSVLNMIKNAPAGTKIQIEPKKVFSATMDNGGDLTSEAATEKIKIPKNWTSHIEKCSKYVKSLEKLKSGEATASQLKSIKSALEKSKGKCEKECGKSCDTLINGIKNLLSKNKMNEAENKKAENDLLLDKEMSNIEEGEDEYVTEKDNKYEFEEDEYEDEDYADADEDENEDDEDIKESEDMRAIKEMDTIQVKEAKIARLVNSNRILREDLSIMGKKTITIVTEANKAKEAYKLLKEQATKALALLKEQQVLTTNYFNVKSLLETYQVTPAQQQNILEKFDKVKTSEQSKILHEKFSNRLKSLKESKAPKVNGIDVPSKEKIVSEQKVTQIQEDVKTKATILHLDDDFQKFKRLTTSR